MKEAVKSVSVETYYSIVKIFFGTHTLTCRRKEAGTTRHPRSRALPSPTLSLTKEITAPFCCNPESAGALLPWGGLRGTQEKEPDQSVQGEGL